MSTPPPSAPSPSAPSPSAPRLSAPRDRRVRRTRDALRRALVECMIDKGYQAVTVQDLIERADVGRSTFYAHYTDKDDLRADLGAQLGDMLGTATQPAPVDRRRPLRFSLELFRHVHDQQVLLRALLGDPGAAPVLAGIERVIGELVREELTALAGPDNPPRIPADLLSRGVVAGFLTTLRWWVDQQMQASPEQVDRYFQILVAAGVRAAVPPATG